MVSVLTLGAMVGAFANGPIADRLSRRWSIHLANTIFLVGSIIHAAVINIVMIFIGRFVAGLAVGQLSMILAPSNLRGSLVSLQQLSITLNIMVASWLDYGTQHIGGTGDGQSPVAWRLPLALQCVPSLLLAAGTSFLPYSPRWLLLKDREEEAHAALLLEIKAAAQFNNETVAILYPSAKTNFELTLGRYKALFITSHLRHRLVITYLMQVIQQFTGINAIMYYAPEIFESIGLSGNSVDLLATGVIGVVNFFSTIPAIMFMDRWGRTKVLIVGGIGMSISQLIVGTIYAVYKDSWDTHKAAGWAAAVFFLGYLMCELDYSVRDFFLLAVGLAIETNWLSNVRYAPCPWSWTCLTDLIQFVVALIIPRMLASIKFGTFYFFLAFCLFLILWVLFLVPETKGVGIVEMVKLFGGSQGEADVALMADIRRRLGIDLGGAPALKGAVHIGSRL
ncbi:Major facilitator-type transporter ecdD [Penicillium argentinense]|uniref:Major facilitator-type transporter ecdD n=1 Tax=Penicillium argentinense TaxID=1131581 RepID=A0A9W9EZI2_9EURO|nr:Major facilitator-type transporter ecdD [Penicillium argentinense]KAJ5090889.1 Major facilitator-type transporter ecdD [Penicillium argentinense]